MVHIGNPSTVSVILPTYNRAHTVKRAIESVLHQSHADFELVIVDDGSTDNTIDVINEITDRRIQILRHKTNRGAGIARNTGIQASQGKYIAFQDSDDEWLPGILEKQVRVLRQTEQTTDGIGVVYTKFWRRKGDRQIVFPINNSRKLEGDIHESLLFGNLVTTQTALVKKSCLNELGLFDENLACLLDWELWIRISKVYRFKHISEPLAIVNYSPEGISSHFLALAKANEYILEKHASSFKRSKYAHAQQLYLTGNFFYLGGEFHRGKAYLTSARNLSPFNLRYRMVNLIASLGDNTYMAAYKLKDRITPYWY